MLTWFKKGYWSRASNWMLRLRYLFVVALLWQCFEVLEGFWWEETYAVVQGLLLTVVLTELLLPGPRAVRLLVQGALWLGINMHVTGFQWQAIQASLFDDPRLWLGEAAANWAQLEPFIWISLAVGIVIHLFALWVQGRSQMITITGSVLAILLIADSFTPLPLWDNIAWTIFIGLIWLVADHFAQFQIKHPDSWNDLREYPAGLFLPALLIIALVMSSGLFVPSIAPLLKDPYTIWKESRGEAVPSFVGDKGLSNSLSGARDSRSGYSRQDDSLGGGFQFDYSTVMEVTTNRRSYWRGETKAFYSGDGWSKSDAERREPSVIGLALDQPLPLEGGPTEGSDRIKVTQTVKMVREDPYPVLFAAAPIERLMAVEYGEEDTLPPNRMSWHASSWELRWPEVQSSAPYPSAYTIISSLPVLDEPGLRQAAASLGSSQQNRMYVQLPAELPQRVTELAVQITAAADNPYDKMKALETYLKNNFVYTNTPDLSRRKSSDFVDAFLFEVLEGYCDYYSSALAVMGRTIGIPTRWVKGYAPGVLPLDQLMVYPSEEMAVNPDGAGTYTVRNADAHSWVEAYFEGYGWIPFEPTAGFTFPYAELQSSTVPELPLPETEEKTQQEKPKEKTTTVSTQVTGYIGLALLAALAAWAVYRRRQIIDALIRYRFRKFTASQRIVWEMGKLLRYGKRKGLSLSEQETARETMTAWSREWPGLKPEFAELLSLFERAKYSGQAASLEELERFLALSKTVRGRL